jgi:hypothetical protein
VVGGLPVLDLGSVKIALSSRRRNEHECKRIQRR